MESQDKIVELSIQFSRHNFDNLQTLIRSSDTKAGVTLTIMVFLGASGLQISKDVVGKLHFQPWYLAVISVLFVVAAIGLLASIAWSFVMVARVLGPHGPSHYPSPQKGSDLMWQDHVLLYKDNEEYFYAIRDATSDVILRNLTDQIFELAHISSMKMRALRQNRIVAWLGFSSWILVIVSGLFLGRS